MEQGLEIEGGSAVYRGCGVVLFFEGGDMNEDGCGRHWFAAGGLQDGDGEVDGSRYEIIGIGPDIEHKWAGGGVGQAQDSAFPVGRRRADRQQECQKQKYEGERPR